MKGWSRDLAALGGLLLLALLLLAPACFAGKTVYYRDVTISDLPQAAFLFHSVVTGQFPIWNALSGGGYPQLAGLQPPFFYPLEVFFLPGAMGWLPWGACLTLLLALHYWLAGAFTYTLCRDWRWSRAAALTAAISFELSGYLVSLHNLFTNLPPASLFPLVLLLTDRMLRQPSARHLALAAGAFALQMSNGRPDITLMSFMYLAAHAGWRAWQQRRQPLPLSRRLLPLTVLLALPVISVLFNAITLVPAWEFVKHSNRAGGIQFVEIATNSFVPLFSIALFLPRFFGNVEQQALWGQYFVTDETAKFTLYYLTLYAGLTVYLLAFFARSPRRQTGLVPFLWLVWGGSFLLALGRYTPLYGWFSYLPLVKYIRYPIKFFFLWSWTLALLAGLGLETLRQQGPGWRGWVCSALCDLTLVGLLLAGLCKQSILVTLAGLDYQQWATVQDLTNLNATMQHLLPLLWPESLLLAWQAWGWAAAGLLLINYVKRFPRHAVPLVAALVAIDLLSHNASFIYYTDDAYFQRTPPLVNYLASHDGAPPERLVRPYGDQSLLGKRNERFDELMHVEHPLEYAFQQALAGLSYNSGQMFGISGISVYGSLELAISSAALLDYLYPATMGGLKLGHDNQHLDRYARVAGAADIGFLMVPVANAGRGRALEPPNLRGNPNFDLVWQDGSELFLYHNRYTLPRAHFVTAVLVEPDMAAVVAALDQSAMHLQQQAILLDDDALRQTLPLRATLPARAAGVPLMCRITTYTNTYVAIDNRSPESGFLVLADNYYPGWQVTVDGQRRPLLLANGFARGVYVEAGHHIVEFRYQPRSFALGVGISGLTLLMLLGLAFVVP